MYADELVANNAPLYYEIAIMFYITVVVYNNKTNVFEVVAEVTLMVFLYLTNKGNSTF